MTDKPLSPWYRYQMEKTGKTEEELRAYMSEKSLKADKKKAALKREANRRKTDYYGKKAKKRSQA